MHNHAFFPTYLYKIRQECIEFKTVLATELAQAKKDCSPSVLPAAVDHFLLLDGLHAGHLLAAKVLRIFTFRFRFCGFNTEGRLSKDF